MNIDVEYDVDTGGIVSFSLFPDETSTIDHRESASADQSIGISTDDGGFTTISNLINEGVRTTSTFEVVELDASSSCISESLQSGTAVTSNYGDKPLISSSEGSPSFPNIGTVVDSHNPYRYPYHNPSNDRSNENNSPLQVTVIQNEDQDQSVCDQSTALSSLTNNDNSMWMKWMNPRDRVEMLFDPFRDAMHPPLFSSNDNQAFRELTGFNRFIATSARNLSSVFRIRPHPHPEFHLNQPHSIPSSLPENITTTHSPSGNSVSEFGHDVVGTHGSLSNVHSVSQLMTSDARGRYGDTIMKSSKYYPTLVPKVDENQYENIKRRKCLLLSSFFALLIVGVGSVAAVLGGSKGNAISSTANEHHQGPERGDGSLPSACCVEDVTELDKIPGELENDDLTDDGPHVVLDQALAAIPALNSSIFDGDSLEELPNATSTPLDSDSNESNTSESRDSSSTSSLEPIEGTGTVSLASSQQSEATLAHLEDDPEDIMTSSTVTPPSPTVLIGGVLDDIISAKLSSTTEAPTSFAYTPSPTMVSVSCFHS